jgi:choline dehydrogenase-like flavoprotein
VADVLERPAARLRAEVAVIGSGPGGAITACLLAEAGRDVVLLEEGPFLPLESCAPFSRQEMVQKYRSGGVTVAMGNPKVAYVEGRCVGGGSEINSGLYHRAPPEILDGWRREYAVQGLEPADLAPFFEANERELSVSTMPESPPAASLKLHQGATALGWKSLEVPRWYRYDGTPGGVRQSMTRTFVPRALAAGCRLVPETRVTHLAADGGRWIAQAVDVCRSRWLRIEADTIFVAAGAVQTPALLRRSGIARNVGNTLRLHPTVKMVARFPDEVNAPDMGVPVHQVKEFAPRVSFGCSISAPPHLALAMLDHPDHAADVEGDWRRTAIYYAMITGGNGSVRPLPGFADPLVRYRLSDAELAELATALTNLGRCLFAAGAEVLYPSISGGPRLEGEHDLAALGAILPRSRTSLMTIHLVGSCPMGERRERCAVDSFGRVHGVRGLHVADASLLCGAPGVNPQGSIMALARRNALAFLAAS